MKTSNFAVLACIVVCTFLAGGLVDSASAAAAPKVTVSPAKAAILLGGSQQFTAKVSGVKNPTVTWSLDATSLANGIQISSSGKVTVPTSITITPDSFKPVVTATYAGVSPNVTGTATFTITDPAAVPGLFLGTINCTSAACNDEVFDLAMNVKTKGAIDGLAMTTGLTEYERFTSAIVTKTNTVTAHFKDSFGTFTLDGQVEYVDGTVEHISGDLLLTGQKTPVGTWSVSPAGLGLAKAGTWNIDSSVFGAALNGTMAGMTDPSNSSDFFGVAVTSYKGKTYTASTSDGTYTNSSGAVTFTLTINAGKHGTKALDGSGTLSATTGKASGTLKLNGATVGAWSLGDL
jgi:hypothetical protein